jgi:vitamin K-dependent gamma-carboxylase
MAATLLFLDADWPRRLGARLRLVGTERVEVSPARAHPGVGRPASQPVKVIIAAWIVVMLVLPLRPFVYPGEAMWTEEGMRLSWHMLLRSKVGDVQFVVERPGEPPERVDPREHLTPRQYRKIATYPEMIRQHAHHLREERGGDVRVRAIARASLHDRPRQELIDPDVDLVAEPGRLPPADWIVPLERFSCDGLNQQRCREAGSPWRPFGR